MNIEQVRAAASMEESRDMTAEEEAGLSDYIRGARDCAKLMSKDVDELNDLVTDMENLIKRQARHIDRLEKNNG